MELTSEDLKRREEILSKVKAARASDVILSVEEEEALDKELASLVYQVRTFLLTSAKLLAAGTAGFTGFLYSTGATCYVADDGNDYLLASKSTVDGALTFNIYFDSHKNLVLKINIGGTEYYWNQSSAMGHCRLETGYLTIAAKEWALDKFKILNPANGDFMGCPSATDNRLYNNNRVIYTEFEFKAFQKDEFTDDEKLIFDAYLSQQNKN